MHLKTIQRYFRKADRQVPSIEELRSAFTGDAAYQKMFPPGAKADTFGFAPDFRQWHDERFGSCFDKPDLVERADVAMAETRTEHQFWFWFGAVGSLASIIGMLAIFL